MGGGYCTSREQRVGMGGGGVTVQVVNRGWYRGGGVLYLLPCSLSLSMASNTRKADKKDFVNLIANLH